MSNRRGKWENLNLQIKFLKNFTVGVGGIRCCWESVEWRPECPNFKIENSKILTGLTFPLLLWVNFSEYNHYFQYFLHMSQYNMLSGTRGSSQIRTDLTDPADGPHGSIRSVGSAGSVRSVRIWLDPRVPDTHLTIEFMTIAKHGNPVLFVYRASIWYPCNSPGVQLHGDWLMGFQYSLELVSIMNSWQYTCTLCYSHRHLLGCSNGCTTLHTSLHTTPLR